ncbi:MAG: prepilin-type N-terminal cleavage/methylation domain-containing protein [Patescibacteria group bacterium]
MNKKGFTLIELLVVIVIIGILATLATVALSSARMKARDARRVSDIKQIQTAMELYYNDALKYPEGVTKDNTIQSGTTIYMAKVPADPQNSGGNSDCAGSNPRHITYFYDTNSTKASYSIQYCLGGTTGSIVAGTHCATPGSIDSDGVVAADCAATP